MKRYLFLLIGIMVATVSMFGASSAKCLLQHQGAVKIYDATAIETAIKNSVDGDTIFLTEGTFPGFTVNKKITVRGAGQNTKVTGDVCINISGTPILNQSVLEGIDCGSSYIRLAAPMNGVKIKQCKAHYIKTEANCDDIIIDRCNVLGWLYGSEYVKGMTVINSNLRYTSEFIRNLESRIYLINCSVYCGYVNEVSGTFINCIMYGENANSNVSPYEYMNSTFVNCLFTGRYINRNTNCTETNSYDDVNCSKDENTLLNLGYLGNDGTVVGEYGGVSPYTLELAVPKVTESTISLDNAKKILNVSLKVNAN